MTQLATLDQKQRELVGLGASLAAGCQPCTSHHFRQARLAGADDVELRQAVEAALCVRDSARMVMADQAERLLGGDPSANGCCDPRPVLGELVCVAAAYAMNCVDNLEKHLEQARAAGATERQLVLALSITRGVKRAAAAEVDAVVEHAPGEASVENSCCDDTPAEVRGARQTSALSPLGSTQAGRSSAAGGACSCSAPTE